ncbi:ferredoxin [Streptomyces sp. NPDC015220]|uniref:ferredoxin n=1 Tax=Streptomyces sp. NPDC015220 TaxID=3364947 RepID=UPI0036FB611A
MAVRQDNRLLEEPMAPVTCGTCGAEVEARKSSWEQTSVQWHAGALASCAERRAAAAGPGTVFTGCRALARAIGEAAVQGRIRVQCDDADDTRGTSTARG